MIQATMLHHDFAKHFEAENLHSLCVTTDERLKYTVNDA